MPLFGAHMSISGGYHNAVTAAADHRCQTVQIFTKNNNQWAGKPITDADVTLFKDALRTANLQLPMAHDSYLINLATPDPELHGKSLEAFVVEVERAETLGLDYLVMHPGTPTDGDAEAGLNRIAQSIDETHRRCPGYHVQILLENTAGQGKSLGHRFEHLAHILNAVAEPDRLGVCLDTCHLFAAGYPLGPSEAYEATFDEFERVVGVKAVRAFHINDSMKPLGSRVDRHAHIGAGCLGLEPFRLLVNDPRFANHPMVLETPKEEGDNDDMDTVNLEALRNLLAEPKAKRGKRVRGG